MSIELYVVTPEGVLVETQIESMVVPGTEGEFGILPGHEPFLAPLQAGELRYEAEGGTRIVSVASGFVEVTAERVTVLAQGAVSETDT